MKESTARSEGLCLDHLLTKHEHKYQGLTITLMSPVFVSLGQEGSFLGGKQVRCQKVIKWLVYMVICNYDRWM